MSPLFRWWLLFGVAFGGSFPVGLFSVLFCLVWLSVVLSWLGCFSWLFSCFSCAWCVFACCFSCCVWLSRSRGGSFFARSRLGGVLDRAKRKTLKNGHFGALFCRGGVPRTVQRGEIKKRGKIPRFYLFAFIVKNIKKIKRKIKNVIVRRP